MPPISAFGSSATVAAAVSVWIVDVTVVGLTSTGTVLTVEFDLVLPSVPAGCLVEAADVSMIFVPLAFNLFSGVTTSAIMAENWLRSSAPLTAEASFPFAAASLIMLTRLLSSS
ncbi:hypothetical protein D3C80_1691540 [compost metagenome]